MKSSFSACLAVLQQQCGGPALHYTKPDHLAATMQEAFDLLLIASQPAATLFLLGSAGALLAHTVGTGVPIYVAPSAWRCRQLTALLN
jgi:hypothetical protein